MSGPTFHTGQAGPLALAGPIQRECLEIRAYRALTRLARPIAPLLLKFRERNGKEDPLRVGERLGRASMIRPDGPVTWIHAASVGETSAILPLVGCLEARRPDLTILLTTGTVTSARFAANRLTGSTVHQYIPLDEPSFVAAFLDHWKPDLGILTEQEVWPNLVLEANRRCIPLALVNARMSDRSFERWQRRATFAADLYSRFAVVLAQNEQFVRLFEAIGAQRVAAVGNLKIDAPAPPIDGEALAALQNALAGRPRFVAASTHEGEEHVIAEAHRQLKSQIPGLVTIIAPRHPDRGAAVMNLATTLGLVACRRSEGRLPNADSDIYVADTIGELGTLYAATPVAFIGGSLIRHGGQNPIEAVRLGAVPITGASTYNFTDAYAALLDGGGAIRVEDGSQLTPTVLRLMGDPDEIDRMRIASTQALLGLSGALERTVAALLPHLPAIEVARRVG